MSAVAEYDADALFDLATASARLEEHGWFTGGVARGLAGGEKLDARKGDHAFLAGLLHGVGKLYILTRADRHSVLFSDPLALEQLQGAFDVGRGKGLCGGHGAGF